MHLACERRGGTSATNPYSDRSTAFHITFYEMIPAIEITHDMNAGEAENTRADEREKKNIEATESLVKTCENNNIRVGYLYEKPRTEPENSGVQIPRPRAFRHSAFTVGAQPLMFLSSLPSSSLLVSFHYAFSSLTTQRPIGIHCRNDSRSPGMIISHLSPSGRDKQLTW